MFGGNRFRAAWSAASKKAKDTCNAIGNEAFALGNLAVERAEQTGKVVVKEIGEVRDGIVHAGKVVAVIGSVSTDALELVAEGLYRKADCFTRRILGVPSMPCTMSARHRLITAMSGYPKQKFDLCQRALMADDVYKDKGEFIPGAHRLGPDEISSKLHLDPSLFAPSDSEFRAAIYETNDLPPKYVLAFKGTTPTSASDWENNIKQGLGIKSDYYERSMQLALQVKHSVPAGSLEVVGHSLGGGLAQAAAAVTGVKGITFNAAGLNPATVLNSSFAMQTLERNMTNYQIDGEVLTEIQTSSSLPEAVGTAVPLPAPSGVSNSISLHSMESVEMSLSEY